MPIRKLPEYMINRLKAGEVVERPASVVKELVENSLDAGSDMIRITINDGGKSLVSVEDNGVGIELTDMDLLLERYATSKIYGEQDLLALKSYGFRGEALASIAEVSKTTVISKTGYSEIGTKLVKLGESLTINHLPVGFSNGTMVMIQDLFYNVPARLKFLKSPQTEFFYCYNYFQDVALYHYDKSFALHKNDKPVFDLDKSDSLMDRITQLYKKDRSKNLKEVSYQDESVKLLGLVSDSGLTFGSADNIKIYVDGRPVNDKIIRRALMDAYARQITPGEYPFAILMLETQPGVVDVNVHPRKSEVKFVDSNKIYQIVSSSIKKTLGENKISQVNVERKTGNGQSGNVTQSAGFWERNDLQSVTSNEGLGMSQEVAIDNAMMGNCKVVGQLWDSYIVLEGEDAIYYVDQHALAERIAYEKMKKAVKGVKTVKGVDSVRSDAVDEVDSVNAVHEPLKCEVLLQPMVVEISNLPNVEEKIEEVNKLGFDCSLLSENKIIIYSVPQIFVMHKVDIEKLFNHIFYLEEMNFDHILDKIFALSACRTSVKAGDKLSRPQMVQLIKEGFDEIPGMFVCQHGRPFFVKSDKKELDKFFDR